ncbi:MAG: hypothetical protein R3B06_14085 [Kofleriaceae bacterium]
MKRLAVVALFVVAACGGKSKTSSVEHADPMMHADGDGMMKEGHPTMPPAVNAFHDNLAPLWHAEAGPQRVTDACGKSGEMDQQLEEVEGAGAPEGVDAAAWTDKVTGLRTAWAAFSDDCVSTEGANFDATFGAAHDAFHALIALLPKVKE